MDITIHLPTFASTIPWILGFVVLVNLALAWRTWISNRKNPVNIFFALAMFMTAWWVIGILGYRVTSSPQLISFFLRTTFTFPVLIAFFFYLFTYYFPYRTTRVSKSKLWLLILV